VLISIDRGISSQDVLKQHQGRLSASYSCSSTYIPSFNATNLCNLIHNSFRPQNSIENSHGGETIVSYDDNLKTVQLRSMVGQSGPDKDGFVFDRVFPEGTPQHELFDFGVKE
jgi:hypothetical protein